MKENIKTIIAASIAVAAIVIISIAAFALTPDKKENTNGTEAKTGSHDATNSDGHHNADNQATGEAIDLTNQAEVSIDIKDFKYSQQNIKIKKGTKVTWTNQDSVQHNVMKSHDKDGTAHDAPSKDEVKPEVLAGPLLAKGESYSFTFNKVESNPYHCSPHPYMTGSVTVIE